jgi:hypothetical protein
MGVKAESLRTTVDWQRGVGSLGAACLVAVASLACEFSWELARTEVGDRRSKDRNT